MEMTVAIYYHNKTNNKNMKRKRKNVTKKSLGGKINTERNASAHKQQAYYAQYDDDHFLLADGIRKTLAL